MHERLTEILGVEVLGEVTRVGDRFFDVGLGRVALADLDKDRIRGLLDRLREAFGDSLQVNDQLYLKDPAQVIRGLVEVSIPIPEGGAPYVLQLTTSGLLSLYERRFLLEPEVAGDLGGMLCRGLIRLVAVESPLRILSGADELVQRYQELLDAGVRAGLSGADFDPASGIAELVPALRRAWRLIPWPLRSGLRPVSRPAQERIAPHDRVLPRTLLLAVDLHDGRVTYQYVHQLNPYEEYEQVLDWMAEIHQAMANTYRPPQFAVAIARASTAHHFRAHFPGFDAMVGPPLRKT